jgi:hypothetical protein
MTAPTPAAAAEVLTPVTAITVPGKALTSFDISFVDSSLGIYALGDRSNKAVDVVNTQNNTFIFQAGAGLFAGATGNNNTSGPDGVLIINHRELWVGDGDSTMKVLSLASGALAFTISTGGANRVDEMCYDPTHRIVLAANNAESPFPFVTFFDQRTKTILKKIVFDGTNNTPIASNGIEQCQWDPRNQKFYITVPEINGPGTNAVPGGVSILDPVSLTVTTTVSIPIASCSGPQGMAIGPGEQILLGCNGGTNMPPTRPTAIIADGTGAHAFGTVLFTINQGAGADMVDYNSATGHYTLAASNYNPSAAAGNTQLVPGTCPGQNAFAAGVAGPQVYGLVDASDGTLDSQLVSGIFSCPAPNAHGGNHSIASDNVTNQYYAPIAGTSGGTLCSSVGGTDALGCILVMHTTGSDTLASAGVVQGGPACAPGKTLRANGTCQ